MVMSGDTRTDLRLTHLALLCRSCFTLRINTNVMKFRLRPPKSSTMQVGESAPLHLVTNNSDFGWVVPCVFVEPGNREE